MTIYRINTRENPPHNKGVEFYWLLCNIIAKSVSMPCAMRRLKYLPLIVIGPADDWRWLSLVNDAPSIRRRSQVHVDSSQ